MMAVSVENVVVRVGSAETVSGVLCRPSSFETGVVIAHGAGGDMHTPLLVYIAERLCEAGFASLRFNFLYKEKGRRSPDRYNKLVDTWLAVYRYFIEAVKPSRVVVAGKSMGGRVVSQLVGDRLLNPAGLVFYGYPLHPPGRKNQLRDAHLYAIKAPMLFFSGSRDSFCDLDLLRPVLEKLPGADLEVVEGGDHSFRMLKSAQIPESEVFERLLRKTVVWLEAL